MKAFLKNHSQTPRKVGLIADMIRGKDVERSLAQLKFLDRKSAPTLEKLIRSALANARNQNIPVEGLVIKTITVDKGLGMKRFMPRSKGRAAPFRRWMSHIYIELGQKTSNHIPRKKV